MKKVVLVMLTVFMLTMVMAMPVFATNTTAAPAPAATDSVSKVINDGFNEVKTQTKEIVFNVVLWALIAATIIFLIARIVMAVISYRQGAGFSLFPIIAAAVILVLLLVMPEALWALLD